MCLFVSSSNLVSLSQFWGFSFRICSIKTLRRWYFFLDKLSSSSTLMEYLFNKFRISKLSKSSFKSLSRVTSKLICWLVDTSLGSSLSIFLQVKYHWWPSWWWWARPQGSLHTKWTAAPLPKLVMLFWKPQLLPPSPCHLSWRWRSAWAQCKELQILKVGTDEHNVTTMNIMLSTIFNFFSIKNNSNWDTIFKMFLNCFIPLIFGREFIIFNGFRNDLLNLIHDILGILANYST